LIDPGAATLLKKGTMRHSGILPLMGVVPLPLHVASYKDWMSWEGRGAVRHCSPRCRRRLVLWVVVWHQVEYKSVQLLHRAVA